MKRIFVALLLVLVVGLLAIPAFAVTSGNQADDSWIQQKLGWMEQRTDIKKANVDKMVEDGTITQEQGETWKGHFDSVYKFHQENGFICPNGGPGGMGMRGGYGMGPGYMQQQNL